VTLSGRKFNSRKQLKKNHSIRKKNSAHKVPANTFSDNWANQRWEGFLPLTPLMKFSCNPSPHEVFKILSEASM